MNEENKEALNNLINSIQEKMSDNSQESDTSTNTSTSSFDVSSLLNVLNNSSNSSTTEETSNKDSGFDPNIMLKIQKILSALNSTSPQKDLLLSLKPFLRKSRQDKMSDYLMILSIISMLNSFKDKGSE